MKKLIYILTIGVCLLTFMLTIGYSAEYWVDVDAPDDTGDGSEGDPKQLILSGIALMSGGDTLTIEDGTYTGANNRIDNLPTASQSARTVIRARNDFSVIISTPASSVCSVDQSSVTIQGIIVKNPTFEQFTFKSLTGSNWVKFKNCGSYGLVTGDETQRQNARIFAADGLYTLFEDCWSFGQARYPFGTSSGSSGEDAYTVFRRCVVRVDWSNVDGPTAGFANYDRNFVAFQNCIVIDSSDTITTDLPLTDGLKAFFTPNGAQNTSYTGCMAIGNEAAGIYVEPSPASTITITNCVVWDVFDVHRPTDAAIGYYKYHVYVDDGAAVTPHDIDHCTFGEGGYPADTSVEFHQVIQTDDLTNSMLINMDLDAGVYAFDDTNVTSHDYNGYWGNTGGRNVTGGIGANSIDDHDPLATSTTSLQYLTRIKSGSTYSGAGSSGDIGATVMKKIGTDGTFYGETGWNTTTANDLWPFPNEDNIKDHFEEGSYAEGFFKLTSTSSCSILTATDRIIDNAHGLSNRDRVFFTGNPIPTGLGARYSYYVVNSTPNGFQVAQVRDAAAIDITSTGSGVSWGEGWNNERIDATRGFCTTGLQLDGVTEVTLTSYIWEYLGNLMPSDIYNPTSGSDRPRKMQNSYNLFGGD